jgi:hypothetical protein
MVLYRSGREKPEGSVPEGASGTPYMEKAYITRFVLDSLKA